MKIALVTPEIVPVMGGISSYSLNVAWEVSKNNNLTLVCPGRISTIKNELAKIYQSLPERLDIVSSSQSDDNSPTRRTLNHQIGLARALKMASSEVKPDIYHFTAPHASGFGGMISDREPNIVTVHSLINQDVSSLSNGESPMVPMRRTDLVKTLLSPMLARHEELVLNRASAVVAVSEDLRSLLSKRLAHVPTHCIENGVDTHLFKPGEPDPSNKSTKTRILFVSRLMPSKGIMNALESCAVIAREGRRDFEFVFVGPGNTEAYQLAARKIGVQELCSFTGNLEYHQMPDMYRSASVFCCPSLQESFPISLLEAMSTGLPCIATRVGSIPEMIDEGKTGIITKPGDPAQLANAIRLLLDEPDLRREYGLNGRSKTVAKYEMNIMANSLIRVYDKYAGG